MNISHCTADPEAGADADMQLNNRWYGSALAAATSGTNKHIVQLLLNSARPPRLLFMDLKILLPLLKR
jgi:hypothetical protein